MKTKFTEKNYFLKVVDLLEKMNIAELVPTEELVLAFESAMDSKNVLLQRITTHMIIYSDWAMLFTLGPHFAPQRVLLKTLLFILSEQFPIEKVFKLEKMLIFMLN